MKTCLRFLLGALLVQSASAYAQCPSGYSTASLNWDYLDFLDPSFPQNTLALCQNQRFAFGTQTVTITTSFANSATPPPTLSKIVGENNSITAKTGTYSTMGDDVQFMGDGNITFKFDNTVANLKFSIYDIDFNQKVTITALNGISSAPVSISKVSGALLTIAPVSQPSTSSSVTAAATTSVATNSTDGAINVDIAGPITSFTIAITQTAIKTTGSPGSQEDGSFWLSDIQACTSGSFSTNYRSVAQPWAGMPSYVLAAYNNRVYYVDPATGKARFIFQDGGSTNINSVAYDPVKHYIYYTYSLTGTPSSDKALRKYDYNMDTMGVVTNDLGALLGIPIYDNGVESGGASFYDGSLYLGIEGNGTGSTSTNNRESKVWKIDFNTAGFPVAASQVYGIDGYNHDWGDFGLSNGTFFDFDADAGNENLFIVPLFSRATTIAASPAPPKQTGIDWQENLYNIGNTGGNPSTGFIASYTTAGVQGTQNTITVNGVALSGSWGDAAEAFKPMLDFGDAPSSYDPNPLTPAMHEKDTALHLGPAESIEWNKTSSTLANTDANDDGLPFVQILTTSGNYYTDLDVYNNSGSNATICAWVDFNGNGIFDPSEGITKTVASSPVTQRIQLFWPGIVTTLSNNSFTYLRIRITSASNGMTTSNPTGYFYNGEVEDYYLMVNSVALPLRLKDFSVQKKNEQHVNLKWDIENDEVGTKYELQRCTDGRSWKTISEWLSNAKGNTSYSYSDQSPSKPFSSYRVALSETNNKTTYSEVKKVGFSVVQSFTVFPNPASETSQVQIETVAPGFAALQLRDVNGKVVYKQDLLLESGKNILPLISFNKLNNGVYTVHLSVDGNAYTTKLIIRK
ncbi:MAG: GEVED domain-containing protein [Flavisolibacter sp.]